MCWKDGRCKRLPVHKWTCGIIQCMTGYIVTNERVSADCRQCIRLGNARAAARVRSEFKVSDKRFCWIRVRLRASGLDEIWKGQRCSIE